MTHRRLGCPKYGPWRVLVTCRHIIYGICPPPAAFGVTSTNDRKGRNGDIGMRPFIALARPISPNRRVSW